MNKNNYRHGDLSFHPLEALPEGLSEVKQNGKFVLAYGEHTGHKHTLTSKKMELFQDAEGKYYLKLNEVGTLTHEEHKTITLAPGIYRQDAEQERDPFLDRISQVKD